jgi:hypothetical protein
VEIERLLDNGDEEGKFGMTMDMHSPYQRKTYHHASRWKTVNGNNLVYDFVTQEHKKVPCSAYKQPTKPKFY